MFLRLFTSVGPGLHWGGCFILFNTNNTITYILITYVCIFVFIHYTNLGENDELKAFFRDYWCIVSFKLVGLRMF